MKNRLFKFMLVAIAVLILAVVILFNMWSNKSEESDRWKENYSQLATQENPSVSMTKEEFKKYLKENNDSLLKQISKQVGYTVRPGDVTNVENIHYQYGDTTIVEMPIFQVDNIYPFDYKDSCWSAKGYFDLDDSKLVFQERGSSVDITKVDFSKREKKMKWLFGGIRIGKKKAYIETVNSCGGDVKVFEIEVQ